MNYTSIDKNFYAWANSKGYSVQTSYKGEEVRGIVFRSKDNKMQVSLGVIFADSKEVELSIFGGKRLRKKYRGLVIDISSLLDQAESQAKDWLGL